MFRNGRKNIALLICDANSDYQVDICQTTSEICQQYDYNLSIFTCFTSYGNVNDNAKGEYNILNLIPYERYDGILVAFDTFVPHCQEQILQNLASRTRCPIISLRCPMADYPCVQIEEKDAIREIVRHLHKEHGYKQIAFMSGPYSQDSALQRKASYIKEMEALGLPYTENSIFEGDFWKNKSHEAAEHFMSLNPRPDAIVCANDYMAASLCRELINMGYRIPDDVAVTGYDNVHESAISIPPLTTSNVSGKDFSAHALLMLHDMLEGKEVPPVQYIYPKMVIRNSCGCLSYDYSNMYTIQTEQINNYNKLYEKITYHTFTSIELAQLKDCRKVGTHLHLLESNDNDINHFHICLGEGSGNTYPKYHSNRASYPKQSTSVYSILGRKEIQTSTFDTVDLIPPEASLDAPLSYCFFPLHYQANTFGYLAISYIHFAPRNRIFFSMSTVLSNALENLRINNKNKQLLEDLNNLYMHDSLTGMYNRHAFTVYSEKISKDSETSQKPYCVISIDMDNLKLVNDKYGHMNGDLALKTIGDAMHAAAKNGEICARIGGDEYAVIGENYSVDLAEQYVADFVQYLVDYNEKSIYDYVVDASYGYALSNEAKMLSLEEVLKISDDRLYIHKRKKKAGRD